MGMLDLCPSVRVCTLCNRALRMALKEFLQHSKESRGVLGGSSRESTKASTKESKHLEVIHLEKEEPCPVPVGCRGLL